MKISIVGSGHVGLVSGAGFAELGHEVVFVATSAAKARMLEKGEPGFHEPGLAEMLKKNRARISATADLGKAISGTEITFICAGTPAKPTGTCDLSQVFSAARAIGKALSKKASHHVAVKSTVPPGTTESLIPTIERESRGNKGIEIYMNPEFTSEGTAVRDFLHPQMVVIGHRRRKSGPVGKLYRGRGPIFETDLRTAEMVKYTLNCFLATKISFINEIGNICEKLSIDIDEVAEIFSKDRRVSPYFLKAGVGFGGGCLPKDVSALIRKARELGLDPKLLEAVMEINQGQPLTLVAQLTREMEIKGKRIAVLGLAFKARTSDTRNTPAIPIIKALANRGAKVHAYDPETNLRHEFPQITHHKSLKSAIRNSHAILVLTEDKEFAGLKSKTDKPIFYGRRPEGPDLR